VEAKRAAIEMVQAAPEQAFDALRNPIRHLNHIPEEAVVPMRSRSDGRDNDELDGTHER
jgi:hypothetical protein